MGLREDREFLKESKEARASLKEAAEKHRREEFNNSVIAREDAVIAHEAAVNRYYEYKDNVKKSLVKEALLNIYEGSMYHPNAREISICESLLGEYIEDVGTTTLLKNMRFSESAILRTIHENVEKYYKIITEGSKADDIDTQTIKPEDMENFWKDIDRSEDISDITDLIRARVSGAEEDFINKNQEDKQKINDVLKDTSMRIQGAEAKNDEQFADAVKESETRISKNQIYKIQHEGRHNVFDRMVRNLSEAVINKEELKPEFVLENGRLNMEKIVESARCMYTLLEMVSTIQLENVDNQYIEDTLKSIK